MIIVDKREKRIEDLRNKNLEAFYDKKIELSPENMMNLGLNMYVKDKKYLKRELYNIFNQSKFDNKKILHPQQVEVLNFLMGGNNLLLSAPTSFGKTFIALEYMTRKSFSNIVFVVPTLALMNELSAKIRKKFGREYNIITNSFESFSSKNIFILVPERIEPDLLDMINYINIDLLVFDEIYKLKRKDKDNKKANDKRLISLNKGYFDIVNRATQVILLGPFIKEINFERTKLNINIVKYFSDYAPVYIKTIYIKEDRNNFIQNNIMNRNSKLIYFDSPNSIYKFCSNNELKTGMSLNNSLTLWCDKYISVDWLPSKMLKKGIGIHHGNIPAFMRRYVEDLYNNETIKNMLCTSTLLEGVNTPTEQLIIYDSKKLSAFQVNNLIGRVGRLDTFKKGIIYFFDKNLERYIIGDEKYETIEIVAESNEIDDIEELLYLKKEESLLDEKQLRKLQELEEKLNIYGKTIDDLKKVDGFTVDSLLLFLDNINELFNLLKKLDNSKNSKDAQEKKKSTNIRSNIIKLFMKIIPDKKSLLFEINKDSAKKISSSVCINALLSFVPNNIYSKINKQIEKNKSRLSNEKLNMFVDYLFYLSFGYIKYELNKIVKYCNFIFDDEYTVKLSDKKKNLIILLNREILRRFEVFNSDDNKILKILLDVGIPYTDAVKIEKYINKKIEKDDISTGKIYNLLEENKEILKQNANLDDVTKDLLDIIV